MALAVLPSVPDLSVRSATSRLAQEFPELSPRSIVLVVRTCREQLRGSPDDALPELVERLARQR
ncbi:MAG: three-helix bundle dimerization domain-containing protein, partial [Blastococcus sp.]